jgi:N-acetyl sugar amidotransferase
MKSNYRICSYCVMDTSVPTIVFDEKGRCPYCQHAEARRPHEWWPGAEGEARMAALVAMLKREGKNRKYDAMVGLSGGVDSAYLAHLMRRKHGLRLLAVHVDGGWNSETAVRNIETLVRALDIDLHTYVVEWQEMRDLQLAFLRASVLNQDIPQDHAFFATLYRTAGQFGIKYYLSGVNYATENIVLQDWGYPSMDGRHVRGVHQKFGRHPLATYPVIGLVEFLWLVRVRKQLSVFRPLDFTNYNKDVAKQELMQAYNWHDYGGKHHESRFTKFYQEIYLPRKFNFDKRRLHLSSLIVSGQMTREEALGELESPLTTESQIRRDMKFVAKKLGICQQELEQLIDQPPVPHEAYSNQQKLHSGLTSFRSAFRTLKLFTGFTNRTGSHPANTPGKK